MIIDLSQSKLFTIDPDIRFAKEYLLPPGTWKELWRRYKLLDYTNGDLRDYLFVKHARNLSFNSMNRWIIRSEIFMLSRPILEKGARMVNSGIFLEYEQYILDELVKTLRFNEGRESKAII